MVCRASGVAAAGAAVAFYFYSRRVRVCGFGGRKEDLAPDTASAHFEGAYQAPSTWMEALLFFAEALRCAVRLLLSLPHALRDLDCCKAP